MASNEDYSSYTLVEEEEVDVSENEFQPLIEMKVIENGQMDEESENVQGDETGNRAKKAIEQTKKTATGAVGNSAKNSSTIFIPKGRLTSATSQRGNRIILRKANISAGSELFDKSALFDGSYFSLVSEHYKEGQKGVLIRKFKAQCSLCSVPVFIIGTGSSTFNFLRHLRRKHGEDVYQSYLSYRQQKNPRARVKNNDVVKRSTNTAFSAAHTSTPIIRETVTVYVPEESVWKPFGKPRQKRLLNSIILEEGISERILADVRDFISSSAWYSERSVPYRRTFLLHGPSGCGKSSFVFALAGELNYGLCVLNLCERELTDRKLNQLLNNTPENYIILLENIDDAFSKPDEAQSSRLTLNGILDCLDGATAAEGRIIFLTCVDTDGLHPSLLRPGRIDVKQHLGFCSQMQILKLVEKFYEAPASYILKFVEEVMKHGKNVSPAQLQGFFLSHKNNDVLRLLPDIQQIWES